MMMKLITLEVLPSNNKKYYEASAAVAAKDYVLIKIVNSILIMKRFVISLELNVWELQIHRQRWNFLPQYFFKVVIQTYSNK